MTLDEDDRPTSPVHSSLLMTVPQILEALSAFPEDQQTLIVAMLRGADDEGFLRGAGGLTRVGPFERLQDASPPPPPPKRKSKR